MTPPRGETGFDLQVHDELALGARAFQASSVAWTFLVGRA